MSWIDGELNELDANRVRAAIDGDPALSKIYQEQKLLKQLLAEHFDRVAELEVPERLQAMLTDNVRSLGSAHGRRASSSSFWRSLTAVAATFAVGFLAIQLVPRDHEQARFVADGSQLAVALDTQLASTQAPGAGVRIGVTFAAEDARVCRTFETAATAGLACRGGGSPSGWQLITTVPNTSSQGQYAQAGSGSAAVMERAQELMKGEPFDAEMEKRARDRGWTLDR
ncbi:MAG: anti-sigma factor [Pseudomonadota bacterium]|nr:anti-sigma factor [Pseudomonadota bacterium]